MVGYIMAFALGLSVGITISLRDMRRSHSAAVAYRDAIVKILERAKELLPDDQVQQILVEVEAKYAGSDTTLDG